MGLVPDGVLQVSSLNIPEQLRTLIQLCLHVDPALRPTAKRLLAGLARIKCTVEAALASDSSAPVDGVIDAASSAAEPGSVARHVAPGSVDEVVAEGAAPSAGASTSPPAQPPADVATGASAARAGTGDPVERSLTEDSPVVAAELSAGAALAVASASETLALSDR
jgi:hypothetical protein